MLEHVCERGHAFGTAVREHAFGTAVREHADEILNYISYMIYRLQRSESFQKSETGQ